MTKKYTAALISLGSESSKRTLAAMENYFDSVEAVQIRDVEIALGETGAQPWYRGEPFKKYDCVYIKGSFRYADIAKSVASLLEGKCYMPVHQSSYTVVHNKFLTHLALQQHDINMPKTYLVSTGDAGKKLLKKIKYPIIIKIPEGTQGKGVMFADSFAAASSLLDTLRSLNQPYIVQEYVETGGEDVRAIVVGNKVVAAMRRRAVEGEVRSNYHAGGSVEAVKLSAAAKKLSVKVAQALQTTICGVDILDSARGPLVIEANISPGLQGIMAATGRDIPDDIAKYLFEQTDAYHEAKKEQGPKGSDVLNAMGIGSLEASNNDDEQQIITTLDFRASRVLLPEVITKLGDIREDTEYVVKVAKNSVKISKM